MFAILQSLNNKQFYNYFNVVKKPTNKENLNVKLNLEKYENKNEQKLYIKDSFKPTKNTNQHGELNSSWSMTDKDFNILNEKKIENSLEQPSNVFLYLVNSIFFFGLGMFANGRWKR